VAGTSRRSSEVAAGGKSKRHVFPGWTRTVFVASLGAIVMAGCATTSETFVGGAGASRGIDDYCYVRPDLPDEFKPFVACVFVENHSTTDMALKSAGRGSNGNAVLAACAKFGGSNDLAPPWSIEVGGVPNQYPGPPVEPITRFTSSDVEGEGIVILRIVVSALGEVTFEQLTEQPSDFTGKIC
jgi:hypothetical protein